MSAAHLAATIFAVLAMSVLPGPLGVLFIAPLAVTACVFVRLVYVEGVLREPPQPSGPSMSCVL